MLFIDYSSAFNNIIPDSWVSKQSDPGLPPLFLTNWPQTVKLGHHLSSTRTLSMGSPQGCVLSPLLYTLYTTDCRPANSSNTIVKFADDMTVVGMITGGDESAYRDEVLKLSEWCSAKTKEITLEFRKGRTDPSPLYIHGDWVERVHTFTFLDIVISGNLSWSTNTSAVIKKAQRRLHFLRVLRKSNICKKVLVIFYHSTIESILAYCITVWFSHCTKVDWKRLQRVVKTYSDSDLALPEEFLIIKYQINYAVQWKSCLLKNCHLSEIVDTPPQPPPIIEIFNPNTYTPVRDRSSLPTKRGSRQARLRWWRWETEPAKRQVPKEQAFYFTKKIK